MVLNDESPWDVNLACSVFALRAIVHTTTQYIPVLLVFGQHLILFTRHRANWHLIKTRKQDLITEGNQRKSRN